MAQPARMDLKAEQCWTRAACYEKIADNESAPKEVRLRFVRQANLLRIMGKLAELDDVKHVSQEAQSRTNPAQ